MRLDAVLALALFAASSALVSCSGIGYRRPLTVEHQRVELESGLAYEEELTGVGAEVAPGPGV